MQRKTMKGNYDFSKGKRGSLIPQKGKTRISIFIDNAVLDEFRARAEKAGTGYQAMMNEALRNFLTSLNHSHPGAPRRNSPLLGKPLSRKL